MLRWKKFFCSLEYLWRREFDVGQAWDAVVASWNLLQRRRRLGGVDRWNVSGVELFDVLQGLSASLWHHEDDEEHGGDQDGGEEPECAVRPDGKLKNTLPLIHFFIKSNSHHDGFYWGHQCSWTLTPANNMQVSNIVVSCDKKINRVGKVCYRGVS